MSGKVLGDGDEGAEDGRGAVWGVEVRRRKEHGFGEAGAAARIEEALDVLRLEEGHAARVCVCGGIAVWAQHVCEAAQQHACAQALCE